MTKVIPTFPQKRTDGYSWGVVDCETGWTSDCQYWPTDGSGHITVMYCSPAFPATRTFGQRAGLGTSNQLAYILGDNPTKIPYTMSIAPDYGIYTYPQDLKDYGAGNTRLDLWKHYVVDNFLDLHGIKWFTKLDQIIQYGGFAIPGLGTVGQTEAKTPATDTSFYTPPSGHISSYETAYGPGMDFIENNCGKNFQGWHFESVYCNCLKWLYNRTKYWVIEKDAGGWTDSVFNKEYVWGSGTTPTTVEHRTTKWPATAKNWKFDYCDEIVPEFMYADMPGCMRYWIYEARQFSPNTKIGINIDTPMRCLDHAMNTYACNEGSGGNAYWAEAGKPTTFNGQPVTRNWWEGLYATQILNWYVENYGPFDSFIYNPLGAEWPANDTPDPIWYWNWVERLYLLTAVNRINAVA